MTNPDAIRLVFMGTPEFSVASFRSLLELKVVGGREIRVVGVFTQPDRPSGRGQRVSSPPVKRAAEEAGVPVYQPERLKHKEAMASLVALQPDLIVVAAYAQILSRSVLDLPRFGCLNVHASLLPRYRGAAPIQAAILDGAAETGVTVMLMVEELDAGAILTQMAVGIEPTDTAETLSRKLAVAGAHVLAGTIRGWLMGAITPVPQDDSVATMTKMLRKEHGLIDWTTPASHIERQVRAMHPWPGAFVRLTSGPLKVLQASVIQAETEGAEPGTLQVRPEGPAVVTGDYLLLLQKVQPAGRRAMSGQEWLRGVRHLAGSVLGRADAVS